MVIKQNLRFMMLSLISTVQSLKETLNSFQNLRKWQLKQRKDSRRGTHLANNSDYLKINNSPSLFNHFLNLIVDLSGISLLIYKYLMDRLFIYLFISVVLVSSTASNDEKGTVGIYVSPDGITR